MSGSRYTATNDEDDVVSTGRGAAKREQRTYGVSNVGYIRDKQLHEMTMSVGSHNQDRRDDAQMPMTEQAMADTSTVRT